MIKELSKYVLILIVLFAGCIADMQSKKWAEKNLKNKPSLTVVQGFVELGFAENHGMVFGILNKNKPGFHGQILLIVRIIILTGVFAFMIYKRKEPFFFHVPFVFIVAGAWGNIFDSLTIGHVIDFIHMHLGNLLDWPFLFNIADAYICIAMGILVIQSFFTSKKTDSTTEKKQAAPC